jgi:hypothetical protein
MKMDFRAYVVLGFLALTGLSAPAFAWNPGDACTGAGKNYFSVPQGPGSPSLICNGATLEIFEGSAVSPTRMGITTDTPQATLDVNGELRIGSTAIACSATNAGAMRYSGGYIQWCNGTAWANIASGTSGAIDDLTDAFTDYVTNHNIIMGRAGAAALTAGAIGNLFIGEGAGATTAASTATTIANTAVGYSALAALTSGDNNTAVGNFALAANTTGTNNTALGYWALKSETTGSNNIAVGYLALQKTTSSDNNIAVGYRAALENTTGTRNVAIGSMALNTNKAKQESTALGYSAMQYADSTATAAVTYNTAVGAFALQGSATAASNTGTENTAVGHSALLANTTGSYNTANGVWALSANTTGGSNTAMGDGALALNTTAWNNTAVGHSALAANTTGASNTAIGRAALLANTTGSTNTAIGHLAGDSITTGAGNIIIGYNVDTSAAGANNELNIGDTIYGDLSTDRVAIGTATMTTGADLKVAGTGSVMISAGTTAQEPAAVNGMLRYDSTTNKLRAVQNSAWVDVIGGGAGASAIDDLTDAYTIYDAGVTSNFIMGRAGAAALTAGAVGNLFIGEGAGATSAASTAATISNTAVGYQALNLLGAGDYNTAFGYQAISKNVTGGKNTAIGYRALRNGTGGGNTAVGYAGLLSTTTGYDNTAVGIYAMNANTTGFSNVAVGRSAMYTNVAKQENTAVGYHAMRYANDNSTGAVTYNTAVGALALYGGDTVTPANNSGTRNTALGHSALLGNTSGSDNTAVGWVALAANTTGLSNTAVGSDALNNNTTGSDNVAIGQNSAPLITTGNWNTILGTDAAPSLTTGSNNIIIGYNVDTSAFGASNELNIGNTIYADLSTDKVGIGVVSPASALDVNGGVKVGNDAAACVAGKAGTLRYTGGTPKWEYCDGSAWSPFEQAAASGCAGPADCPTIGNVCTDGSVFAGCVPSSSNTPFFVTRCDYGQTWGGASCGGTTTQKKWSASGVVTPTTTNVTSYTDGAGNTATLITLDSDSGTAGTQLHDAAQACSDLSIHGKTDWYLPAAGESIVMWINKTAIGNFTTSKHWTSTEYSNANGVNHDYTAGTGDLTGGAKTTSREIRCARHN